MSEIVRKFIDIILDIHGDVDFNYTIPTSKTFLVQTEPFQYKLFNGKKKGYKD